MNSFIQYTTFLIVSFLLLEAIKQNHVVGPASVGEMFAFACLMVLMGVVSYFVTRKR